MIPLHRIKHCETLKINQSLKCEAVQGKEIKFQKKEKI